jgi:predicted ATPase/class 3 adenylate cyclase
MTPQPTGTVTLLFSDIEGSTRLLERLGRDRYAEALDLHRRLLRQAFQRHRGYEVDCEGDSFFVAFSRAEDAAIAAQEAQQALARSPWPDGLDFRVRMGIHTGEPLAVPPKYVGLDVHKAARIMAAGHGGQVLVSRTTRRLLSGIELVSLGEHQLKDLLQPEPLFQLSIEGLPSEFPGLKTLGNRPTNLPVQPTPLIGRERELAEVCALLRVEDVRLLALTGAGGTGKTRLALQVGADLLDEFQSGVFLVSLAPIADPELVIPAVAQALAVRAGAGEEPEDAVAAYLEDKQMLLLLDNFEQVISAAAPVAALLLRCPKLRLLVTSRERLRAAGERVYVVPPLQLPEETSDASALAENEAVALFVSRARAAMGEFSLTRENAAVVASICRRLDGLPLAIELAAARTTALPPRALLARLDQRLPLLTHGARDADERQRTLRKTIEWSYDLLDARERTEFARLGIFVGGCRLEAAEHLCDLEGDRGVEVLGRFQSLVEKSLARRQDDPDGEPRFGMLETIREYSLERLGQTREADELRRGHAEYFVAFAEQAELHLTDAQQAVWLERLERELDNLRVALVWCIGACEVELELRLVGALWRFWATRGDRSEGRRRLEEALARDWPQPLALREKALAGASRLAQFQNDLGTWEAFANERLAVNRELANPLGIAATLTDLAILVGRRGKNEEARVLLEESRSISHESGETREEARAVANLGALAWEQGDYERAMQSFGESIPLFEIVGDLRGIAVSANGVGRAAVLLRRPYEGLAYLERSLSLAHSLSDQHEASLALEGLALIALEDGDAARATRLLAQADALRQAVATFATPREQAEFEHAVSSARTRLGEAAFDVAWSEGLVLTLAEAVAYAREEQP